MTLSDTGPSFQAFGSRRLRRAGVNGRRVRVTLEGDELVLTGAKDAVLRIHARDVERLRSGYEETKYSRLFQTRLWRRGARAPLLLLPADGDIDAYGITIRAFAARLAGAGGIARVERGISAAGALMVVVLTSFPAVAYCGIALFIGEAADALYWLAGSVPFLVLSGIFIWHYQARLRPSAVRDLRELEQQTPGPNFRL